MNWRLKAAIQAGLGALPPAVGDPLYHALQRRRGLRPNAAGHRDFVSRVERALADVGQPGLAGRSVVELGSGWFPLTPLLLISRGVALVQTFDTAAHYSPHRVRMAAEALRSAGEEHESLRHAAESGRLPDRVLYQPRRRLEESESVQPADLGLSRFTLEHVPPRTIERLHWASRAWMPSADSLWLHWVSPSDHRAYDDGRLSLVDFLRYSDEQWRRIAGNRFAYHNRLRRSEFRSVFERGGWRVAEDDCDVSPSLLRELESMTPADRFRGRPPDDLVAANLWFVLEKAPEESGSKDETFGSAPRKEE